MGGGNLASNNKKGFTLLEVLAVIIVLAVIALITIPIISNVMAEAKKNSFKTSMNNLVKAANNYYADNQLEIDKVMTFCFGLSGSNCTSEKLSFTGKKPEKGKLVLNPDGEVSLIDVSDGTYYANYDSSVDDEVVVTEDNEVLNRDELTQAIKDLQAENKVIKQQLESTTKIANTANSTANSLNNNMLNKTYPVGSIYISYNSTNPKDLFGGTWVAYGTGRTLVGVDTSQTEFNTVGKTGGEKNHVLTTNEMPSHMHSVWTFFTGYAEWTDSVGAGTYVFNRNSTVIKNLAQEPVDKTAFAYTGDTNKTGGSKPHNNLQPYITVYMWRRTA